LYLYGWPMQQLAMLMGATTLLTNTITATALALVCAALSWFLIERPALGLKRRLLSKRAST
jgi:peptidoglycan/LPS O-acetylase OafA/YrhL